MRQPSEGVDASVRVAMHVRSVSENQMRRRLGNQVDSRRHQNGITSVAIERASSQRTLAMSM